jgi:slime mold cyclic AMP receptor
MRENYSLVESEIFEHNLHFELMASLKGLFSMTTRQAIWAVCGMLVGGFCWIGGVFLGYRYGLNYGAATQALNAAILIGGILGWIAAKVLPIR